MPRLGLPKCHIGDQWRVPAPRDTAVREEPKLGEGAEEEGASGWAFLRELGGMGVQAQSRPWKDLGLPRDTTLEGGSSRRPSAPAAVELGGSVRRRPWAVTLGGTWLSGVSLDVDAG